MDNILIIGSTEPIERVANQLSPNLWENNIYVLSPDGYTNSLGQFETVNGDFNDPDSLFKATENMDYVILTADIAKKSFLHCLEVILKTAKYRDVKNLYFISTWTADTPPSKEDREGILKFESTLAASRLRYEVIG